MIATPLAIKDIVLLEPDVFRDDRGFFLESFNQARFEAALGRPLHFVQDNHSLSVRGTLRGLHYQIEQPQGKLIRVIEGEIFDVVVDLRRHSATFGQALCHTLSAETQHQLWVPEGFAHGFYTLSETAQVLYKTTAYFAPEHERCLRWNEPLLGIEWPLKSAPLVSSKDAQGLSLAHAPTFT